MKRRLATAERTEVENVPLSELAGREADRKMTWWMQPNGTQSQSTSSNE